MEVGNSSPGLFAFDQPCTMCPREFICTKHRVYEKRIQMALAFFVYEKKGNYLAAERKWRDKAKDQNQNREENGGNDRIKLDVDYNAEADGQSRISKCKKYMTYGWCQVKVQQKSNEVSVSCT